MSTDRKNHTTAGILKLIIDAGLCFVPSGSDSLQPTQLRLEKAETAAHGISDTPA
jgi:hypothetical protein